MTANWKLLSEFVFDYLFKTDFNCLAGTEMEEYDFKNLTSEQLSCLFCHTLSIILNEEPEKFFEFVEEILKPGSKDKTIH